MKALPLTGPDFHKQTPETFMAHCKSLMSNKTSKEVSGISISTSTKKTIIKINREVKEFQRDELTVLAKEYGVTEEFLLEQFKKRKIKVIYADSDPRRDTEIIGKTKKNAGPKAPRKRKARSLDKLQQLVDNSRLLEESTILTFDEVEK